MGQRYGHAFKASVDQLMATDPRVARKLAAAAFSSRQPVSNAARLSQTTSRTRQRMPRRLRVRADRRQGSLHRARSDPSGQAVHPGLRALRPRPDVARPLSRRSRARWPILRVSVLSHRACRASDPPGHSQRAVRNYHLIMEVMREAEPRHARKVANQGFRSHDPLTWTERFRPAVEEQQSTDRRTGHHVRDC
jgi:hypothetical protein